MSSVVYVGVSQQDAQAIAMRRRAEDRGKHVVLLTPGYPAGALGLIVSDWHVTEAAMRHPQWPALHESLHTARVKAAVTEE